MRREDITQEILLRLPVKSLVRCKSLSKEWQEFISRNPAFRKDFMDRNRGCSFMLGFYLTKHIFLLELQEQVHFLPTYNRGISVFNKKMGKDDVFFLLDEPPKKNKSEDSALLLKKSPNFFSDPAVRVLGSSNGFLLCSLDQKCPLNYIIINPTNMLCVSLPVASTSSDSYNHGFICRSTSPRLDTVDYYKVVRGITPEDWHKASPTAFEIISSDSSQWSLFCVSGPSPFNMNPTHSLKIIISETGLIYVPSTLYKEEAARADRHHGMMVLDGSKEDLHVMLFPPTENKWICQECVGQSEGSILYARNEVGQLKIWRMNDPQGGGGWSLIHNVSMESWMQQFKCILPQDEDLEFCPEAFHPLDQNVIFLIHERKRLVYDLGKSKVESFCDLKAEGLDSVYYLFPYTCGLIGPTYFFVIRLCFGVHV